MHGFIHLAKNNTWLYIGYRPLLYVSEVAALFALPRHVPRTRTT